MTKDRAWYDARQKVLGEASEKAVKAVLEKGETFPTPLEQTYFLGATGTSVLVSGYLNVLMATSGAGADE